ncbi:hypothetical protein FZO89_16585 [Luteimonas viscosa]|uniref:Uncharacterized protein n=1 Tax=Luteimonas viscosa TaxID=1132694 RepID=A0A5D4XIS2_9GAMM|nr:hypothetical protein [Luteimonas viscosa]TYT23833.1 hypothetical protein FZO89_16585 [Luteimonas viscosa]
MGDPAGDRAVDPSAAEFAQCVTDWIFSKPIPAMQAERDVRYRRPLPLSALNTDRVRLHPRGSGGMIRGRHPVMRSPRWLRITQSQDAAPRPKRLRGIDRAASAGLLA